MQNIIKKKLQLKESETIFLFANRNVLHFNDIMGDVFKRFSQGDQHARLVLEYTEYSTFGG